MEIDKSNESNLKAHLKIEHQESSVQPKWSSWGKHTCLIGQEDHHPSHMANIYQPEA